MERLSLFLYVMLAFLKLSDMSAQTQIPFSLTDDGHLVISAKVNGTEGQFIFDTGAGLNLITRKFADKAGGLKETPHFYTGHRATGEALQLDLFTSESFEMESFQTKGELFSILDIDFPLDGLISLTPFLEKAVTVDLRNNTFTVESTGSLAQLLQQEHFILPLQVTNDRGIVVEISTAVNVSDSLMLNVRLDSGAGFDSFRFNSRYMPLLGIDSTEVRKDSRLSYFRRGHNNTFYYAKVSNLKDEKGKVVVKDINVTFISDLIYEGILGINWIGEVITVDLPNRRLIVQK